MRLGFASSTQFFFRPVMFCNNYLNSLLKTHHNTPGLKRLQCRHWVRRHCFRRIACHYRHEIIPAHMPLCSYNEKALICPLERNFLCVYRHDESEIKRNVPIHPPTMTHAESNQQKYRTSKIIEATKSSMELKLQAAVKSIACLVNVIEMVSFDQSIVYSEKDREEAIAWVQNIDKGENVIEPSSFAILDL